MKVRQNDDKISLGGSLEKELEEPSFIGDPPLKPYTNNQGLPWLKNSALMGKTPSSHTSGTYSSPSYVLTPHLAFAQQPFSPQTSPRYSKEAPQTHRQYNSLSQSQSQEDHPVEDISSPRPHPPSFPSPSSKQYSAIINQNNKNKHLKFVPYKSTHPDLLERITQIVSTGMKEIEKLFEEDQHNHNQMLLKKLQDKKVKNLKKKLEKMNNNNNNNENVVANESCDEMENDTMKIEEVVDNDNQEVNQTTSPSPIPSTGSDSCLTGLEVGGSVYAEEESSCFNDKSNNDKINFINDILKENLLHIENSPSKFNTTRENFEVDDFFTFSSPNNLYSYHKLKIYDYAFHTYIENSSIYQSFLKDVRDSYWNHINKISSYFISYEDNINRIKKREVVLEKEILKVKHESSTKISELKREINLLEFNIEQSNEKRIAAEKVAKEAKDNEALIKKSYDDLKKSCVTITSSLSRMEEEHRKYLSSESIRLTEVLHLRAHEQKLNEEIERLQQLNQHLEQVQGTMLSAEAAAALDLKFELMQSEMLKMEKIHKQLIIRYSNLKSIVEDCIVKWSSTTASGSLPMFNTYLRNQVQMRLDSFKEKDISENNEGSNEEPIVTTDISLLESFQKTILKNDIDPSIIISTLLDRIDTSSRFTSNNSNFYSSSMKQSTSNVRPVILGGDSKQKNLSCMFSSENVESNSLISENNSKQEQFFSPWKHFDGYGYQDFVPKYLRFHGKIHNFFLTKKEIILLINEIWLAYYTYQNCLEYKGKSSLSFFNNTTEELYEIHKQIQSLPLDSFVKFYHQVPKSKFTNVKINNGELNNELEPIMTHELFVVLSPNPSLSQFSVAYFKEKLKRILEKQVNSPTNNVNVNNLILPSSSVSTPVIELCYNFLDGIKRFYSHSDCKLFSYIFRDKLSHDVYIDQVNLIENLRNEVEKEVYISKSSNFGDEEVNCGDLKLDQFLRLLRRLFPNKSEHSLNKLSKAILLDNQTGRYIKSKVILGVSIDGRTSNFLEQLKIQHINEIIAFEKHLIDVLEQFAENFNNENNNNPNSEISESYYDTKQKSSKNVIKTKMETTVEEIIYNEENNVNENENNENGDNNNENFESTIPLNNFPLLDFDSTFSMTSRSTNAQKLTMSVGQLREALCYADTNKTREEINVLLARGCACDLESLLLMEAKRSPIRLVNFISKIRKGILKKSLPPNSKSK